MDKTNHTARRAIAAARLALSAERLGSTSEMTTAAHIAGTLARKAGLAIEALATELIARDMGDAWFEAVDAYYAAA